MPRAQSGDPSAGEQLTPHGSAASVTIGTGLTPGLQLCVADAEAARAELAERGVEVSKIQHIEDGVWHDGPAGPYNTFFFFKDPRWKQLGGPGEADVGTARLDCQTLGTMAFETTWGGAVSNELERRASQDAEGRYRGLLEAAPDAMVVVNQAGEIVLLNVQAEKRFGYQRDELVGQQVTNIIPVGFAERLIADDLRSAADALAQQIGTGIELSARRKDGTEFPIEIMLSPLESAEGILVTAAIRDITVRKEAENELLQAQKMESIGRLAGGIAHDFNNMLSIIHGYAELLDEDLSPANRAGLNPDAALRSVHAISGAASRASALTAQLLAFSRQQVVRRQVLDINSAVKAIEPMLGPLIGKTIHLELRLDAGAGAIRADPGQIDQIVVNLVVNARDAMPDGGTVTIETARVAEADLARARLDAAGGPYVLLAVSDTGAGMDQAMRQHAFEPFFTTKETGKGTGLGLATTHGILLQAGGSISLDSEPGRGSTFRLYFPRLEAAAEEPSQMPRSPSDVGVGRILVVEDEPDLRELTTQLLQRAGYEVVGAADGSQALAMATQPGRFDALVADVVMPNMSGIELGVQMIDRDPQLGVVLLSGYTPEALDLERVTAAGATFVPKPITSARLLEAVSEAVALRRSQAATARGDVHPA